MLLYFDNDLLIGCHYLISNMKLQTNVSYFRAHFGGHFEFPGEQMQLDMAKCVCNIMLLYVNNNLVIGESLCVLNDEWNARYDNLIHFT